VVQRGQRAEIVPYHRARVGQLAHAPEQPWMQRTTAGEDDLGHAVDRLVGDGRDRPRRDRDDALTKLDERLARRVALALSALRRDGAIYAEDAAVPASDRSGALTFGTSPAVPGA
jgi:hypothetical protein